MKAFILLAAGTATILFLLLFGITSRDQHARREVAIRQEKSLRLLGRHHWNREEVEDWEEWEEWEERKEWEESTFRLLADNQEEEWEQTHGEDAETSATDTTTSKTFFRVKKFNYSNVASEIQIEIVNPKPFLMCDYSCYSVTIESYGRYTGTATLVSPTTSNTLMYSWKPSFQGVYVILVHELLRNEKRGRNKTPLIDPSPYSISIDNGPTFDMFLKQRLEEEENMVPCQEMDGGVVDRFIPFEGDWIGPDFKAGNALRNGWSFLPSRSMNCSFETFTTEDLLRERHKKSIYVIGTSRERGVFLSLVDLLLTLEEKLFLESSVIGKCWGRAVVKKGNVEVTYQDFRVNQFEQRDAVKYMECHNDKVSKEPGALFIENATLVWEEIFRDEDNWPSVILMLTGFGTFDYDFEYHLKESFVDNLPPTWNGTLYLTDFRFSALIAGLVDLQTYQSYVRTIRTMANQLDGRVRYIDGYGISKDHRQFGELGPMYVAQSQHFHRFCNVDVGLESNRMVVCSNITELIAQLLIGSALGPKKSFLERNNREPIVPSTSNVVDATMTYCHACPQQLLPFHITPYPDMTCVTGNLHARTVDEIVPSAVDGGSGVIVDSSMTKCPDFCLEQKVKYAMPSQSDLIHVRQCPIDTSSASSSPVLEDESDGERDEKDDDESDDESDSDAKDETVDDSGEIPYWIETNLADVLLPDDDDDDNGGVLEIKKTKKNERHVPFFWLIPEAAGTSVQNLYWCMGLTLANEIGGNEKFGHENDASLVEFQPFHEFDWHVLNVDLSSKSGILRAKELGLVASTNNPTVDLVVSKELGLAAEHLFDESHKGKTVAMFRHPVDRAKSLFYYLRKAEWDPSYKAEWKDMTIEDYANDRDDVEEHNWMVRKLVGKESEPNLGEDDLELAKEIVRAKILVGLEDKFDESISRFNTYLGIDDTSRERRKCMKEFAQKSSSKNNVKKGSQIWNKLTEKNNLDVRLYEYVLELYEQQGGIIELMKMEDSS